MEYLSALILGIVQGLTEFLPVSSSGHLTLASILFGINADEGQLLFDLILHLGTLVAVVAFYWKDIVKLFQPGSRQDWKLIILATIPTVIIGIALSKLHYDQWSSNFYLVCIGFTVTGVLLFLSETYAPKTNSEVSVVKAILIGIMQGFAILRGVSRSGSTIALGMFMGIRKEQAARFSFLICIPAVLGGFCYKLMKYDKEQCEYFVERIEAQKSPEALELKKSPEYQRAIQLLNMDDTTPEYKTALEALDKQAKNRYAAAAPVFKEMLIKLGKNPSSQLTPGRIIIGFLASLIVGFFCLGLLLKVIQSGKFRYFAYYLWCLVLAALVIRLVVGPPTP